jgi:Putative Ig domain
VKKLSWIVCVLGCLLWATLADAKTLYVSKSGKDGSNSCASSSSPCATIAHGLSAMSGGDTLIIGDGTYTEQIVGMPNGSAAAYTTIQAADDWGVTIDGSGFANNFIDGIRVTGSYIAIRGFHVKMSQASPNNTGVNVYSSDHVKIQRCSVSYGGTTDNPAAINVGPASDYTLIEESYAYGGGRYPFIVYQSTHTVVRRCVSRLDYWNGDLQAANFANYNGDMTVWENNIAIDSDSTSIHGSGLYAGFFNENKVPDSSWSGTATRETYRGNIVLNVQTIFAAMYDYDISNLHTYSDNIIWNSFGGYYADYVHGDAPVLNATRMTIGKINGKYDGKDGEGAWGTGFFVGPGTGSTKVMNTVTDSIFWYEPSYGIADYTSGDYNSFWMNGANYGGAYTMAKAGAHDMTSDMTAGLKYLPRIEAGSALTTAGDSGGQVGATAVSMWGTTGTLWGDPGYDTITTDPLWPYPNEAVIKTDMASYTGPGSAGERGFTTGNSLDGSPQTLTKYIWEYLGNQIPADVYGFHIQTTTLPVGTVGVAYSAVLGASGGMTPYTWSITGSLPPGLTFDAATGTIEGTPTTAGTTTITIVVNDSSSTSQQAMQAVQIQIVEPGQSPDGGAVIVGTAPDGGPIYASPDGGTNGSSSSGGGSGSSGGNGSLNASGSASAAASGGCSCREGAPVGGSLGLSALGIAAALGLLRRRRHTN